MPSATLRALLAELIDYAGLFPPAALPMRDVVANFGAYRTSPDQWALGRLVIPVARLDELAQAMEDQNVVDDSAWRVSALIGEDVFADAYTIADWNGRGRIVVESAEVKAATPSVIAAAVDALGQSLTVYVEIPVTDDPRPLTDRIRRAGARAKIRTGGVTPDVFPTAAQIARFISACNECDLPFKATAGLHHPLRAEYPLTYASDAARAMMFGFLNVLLAAAFARTGMSEAAMTLVLDERDAAALCFGDTSIVWNGHALSADELVAARKSFAISFGSCSFREPIEDIHQLGLL